MVRRVLGVFLFWLALVGSASAQSCGTLTTLVNGMNADATQVNGNFQTLLCLLTPRGYINGLTLSTAGTSTFSVAAGVATSDDSTTLMNLSGSISKTTGPWAVGPNNGALDTGSIANTPTWYHVFEIERVDTGVVDILISISPTTPTLPTNYTKQRRIGSMKTNGSGQWLSFLQIRDSFYWQAPVQDIIQLAVNSTPANLTLVSVPTGISVRPIMNVTVGAGASNGTARVRLYSPLLGDGGNANRNVVVGISVGTGPVAEVVVSSEYTDTSARLRYVNNANDPNVLMDIFTLGWVDNKGQ